MRKIKKGIKNIIPETRNLALRSFNGIKNLTTRSMDRPSKPKWLWFEATDRCNSRCVFCNIWRKEKFEKVLTPEEIHKIFTDDLFNNLKYVLISGGEAMLRPDIKEVVLAIHRAVPKARIQLSTNGSLAEQVIELVKFAVEEHNIDFELGVSLDGLGEDHDRLRGIKGLFDKINWLLPQMVKLKESYGDKFNYSVGFVLVDSTVNSLIRVKEYVEKMGIPFNVQWYNESSYYDNIGKNLLKGGDSLPDVIIKNLKPSITNTLAIKSLKGESIKFPCFGMYTFCLLECNGNMLPCFNMWDFKVGNTREFTPTEIWHSARAKEARSIVKKCQGCSNGCAIGWSFESSIFPAMPFYIKRGINKIRELKQ